MFLDVLAKTVWEDVRGGLAVAAVVTLLLWLVLFPWRQWWSERP